ANRDELVRILQTAADDPYVRPRAEAANPQPRTPANMNVILTWSQTHSHDIALYLREWLAEVLPGVKPWVSSEDIQKGKKWFEELMTQFGATRVCIIASPPRMFDRPGFT